VGVNMVMDVGVVDDLSGLAKATEDRLKFNLRSNLNSVPIRAQRS